jgi:Ca2+-transporting ATPase
MASSPAWHTLDADAAIRDLGVDPARGLAGAEAARQLAEHGPNELTHEEKASPWRLFFNQFKNVLVAILIVATVLSAFVGEYVDAAIILVIIVLRRSTQAVPQPA